VCQKSLPEVQRSSTNLVLLICKLFINVFSLLFVQPSSYEDPLEDDYCFVEETVDDVDEWMEL
jgi:hypothetical protein